MSKPLSYADAAKLLGQRDSKLVAALDKITGGAILAGATVFPGLLGLLGAKSEFVKLSHQLVRGISERRAVNRFDRTQRLEAAHAVIVLVAFFEAFDDLPLQFNLADLELSKSEQLGFASNRFGDRPPAEMVQALLDVPVPMPVAQRPYEATVDLLFAFFAELAYRLANLIHGLSLWDRLNGTQQQQCDAALADLLPPGALRRYYELFRQLAAEFPEIGFWWSMWDSQATRAEARAVGTALAEMEEVLTGIAGGGSPDTRRAELARRYRASLDRPIINPDDVPEGLQIPLLRDAYVDPCFRVSEVESGSAVGQEHWWEDQPIRRDMYGFLIGFLTSPQATEAPLLVLGHPGSGKSVLTRVIAAQLPPSDFMIVRVELRSTPTEADLLGQIGYGLREALKEEVSWATLARSAGDALVVILLDGFDELLQATGVSQTNYLTKVSEFQRDCIELGRPVAVLVTSRTSVADRAQSPQGTVAVRLEPFDAEQIAYWLTTWNEINDGYFRTHSLQPLSQEAVQAYRALAEQPLLLLMLALYDADGNALQRTSASMGHAELYERLLRRFALREVTKDGGDVADVARELQRLSVVAFAMFNRRSQWVTEADLDRDLAALLSVSHPSVSRPGMRTPLGAGETILGRFFFVQRAQARRDDTTLSTYEFLHATFGEFLVARFTWHILRDMVAREATTASSLLGDRLEDSLLHAVLSFAPLTERGPIVGFLGEFADAAAPKYRAELFSLLVRLFRAALDAHPERAHQDYQPTFLPMPARYAAYSANLVVLATIVRGEVRAGELFEPESFAPGEWRSLALLWQSQLPLESWDTLTRALAVGRGVVAGSQDITLAMALATPRPPAVDPKWTFGLRDWNDYTGHSNSDYRLSEWRRQAHFVCDRRTDMISHAVENLEKKLDDAFHSVVVGDHGSASPAHLLLTLVDASTDEPAADRRVTLYRQAGHALHFPSVSADAKANLARVLFKLLRSDVATKTVSMDELDLGLIELLNVHDTPLMASWLYEQLGRDPANDHHVRRFLQSVDGFSQVLFFEPILALDACLRLAEQNGPALPTDIVELLKGIRLPELQLIRPDLITRARRELREQGREEEVRWPD